MLTDRLNRSQAVNDMIYVSGGVCRSSPCSPYGLRRFHVAVVLPIHVTLKFMESLNQSSIEIWAISTKQAKIFLLTRNGQVPQGRTIYSTIVSTRSRRSHAYQVIVGPSAETFEAARPHLRKQMATTSNTCRMREDVQRLSSNHPRTPDPCPTLACFAPDDQSDLPIAAALPRPLYANR